MNEEERKTEKEGCAEEEQGGGGISCDERWIEVDNNDEPYPSSLHFQGRGRGVRGRGRYGSTFATRVFFLSVKKKDKKESQGEGGRSKMTDRIDMAWTWHGIA